MGVIHHIDVTRLLRRLKSSFTRLPVLAENKEHVRTPHYWPLSLESTDYQWIPLQMTTNAERIYMSLCHNVGMLQNLTWFRGCQFKVG